MLYMLCVASEGQLPQLRAGAARVYGTSWKKEFLIAAAASPCRGGPRTAMRLSLLLSAVAVASV